MPRPDERLPGPMGTAPSYIGIGNERGLTLLELLLVVTILSAVAWVSLASVANDAEQIRYDDTRNRLRAIRGAVVGDTGTAGWEKGIQSGFVVDNGRLPGSINDLIMAPSGFLAYGPVSPLFDPAPDTNGYNNGGETTLNQAQNQFMKGFRGSYLVGSAGGTYRDGWGTRLSPGATLKNCPTLPSGSTNSGSDLDSDNHGWCVTLYNDGLYVDSYGKDGENGGNDFESDMAMGEPVLAGDWRINLSGAGVRIVNQSGADLSFSTAVRASLLIFHNGASATWRRITSGVAADTCLDGDGDGLCGGAPAPRETTATLPAENVPAGEHLLVLVADPDGTAHNADDSLYAGPVTARVKFFSRGGVPDLVLIIR